MASILTDYDKDSAHTLLEMYSEMKVYNANTMKEIARDLADRMQAESERCREIEAGEYDESKRPDPEAWCYWISAMDGLETTVESVLFDE